MSLFERMFQLQQHGTTVRTELLAGITTFLTMSYIVFVNPEILGTTGMDAGAVFVATCLAAALGSAVMALAANFPVGMAPGMGLNAFFAFTVVGAAGLPWQQALAAVLISGIVFLVLSLTGVRDLSVIGTPPVDRLSIRTYVSEFDSVTVREALLREKYRGGQSFFVVPRLADLPDVEHWLKENMPELNYLVAHGQLAAGDLDQRMNAFYDRGADVLLATTIVESGLDIPTANTMVVWRADMFGLAQLYQIRGRVGRSKTRAYCYLTTKPRVPLTPQAMRRLKFLGSIDSLGAGFNLASQDLDLRGAGNLLGEEQSGHIKEVGFELYQQMLEETIAKLKSGEIEGTPEDEWAPQLNLGVPVTIPESYIPDLDVRLGLYRRLAELTTKVELEGFAAELIDRFGPLPREVNTLLLVIRIKAMAKRANISKLDAGPKGATVQFHMDKFPNPAGLVEFMNDNRSRAKITGNKIFVADDWKSDADRIKGAFAVARDLAAKAKAAR